MLTIKYVMRQLWDAVYSHRLSTRYAYMVVVGDDYSVVVGFVEACRSCVLIASQQTQCNLT
jgi:hypothetical protein